MSAPSDFNMLRLEAPRELLQLSTDDKHRHDFLEVVNLADWMQAIANHQHQAE